MIKMKIKINEEKVKQSGKYNVNDIYTKLDTLAQKIGIMEKEGQNLYVGSKYQDDFAKFGRFIIDLTSSEWFTPYVGEWLWYVDGGIEDVAQYYKTKGVLV